ncbi:polyphosphate kinase 2, PA0141 family [Lutibacter oricola]|uniref:ADP/GDP-polyphosphate phosphotransferase n=1 Tax=Lutibacter oricola TaxID=762486 RepID=A0A1H2VVU3_9FLAO|nr:polyphosphate kinase 2 [Lutibacter oricola]SDW72478.1 polyphosphate kinase 2, PA0141 family [Lutibacter oricola]
MHEEFKLTEDGVKILNTNKGLTALLSKEPYNLEKAVRYVNYEKRLKKLQVELIRMQSWAIEKDERIIVLFEGRDAAGKGGAIRRITERMNPRHLRIVALPKPTEDERSQWYFQRYVQQFPKAGEIVFFDRSWYNRAVVEPVMGFCTETEHEIFMNQVNDFERMITESGIRLVKIYMSISKREQAKRFLEIKSNPLKQWKMTKVDEMAQELWDKYTAYKNKMFEKTKEGAVPWKIIKANRKTFARVNVINHILKSIPYDKNKEI